MSEKWLTSNTQPLENFLVEIDPRVAIASLINAQEKEEGRSVAKEIHPRNPGSQIF
jgi:hypothetical protein